MARLAVGAGVGALTTWRARGFKCGREFARFRQVLAVGVAPHKRTYPFERSIVDGRMVGRCGHWNGIDFLESRLVGRGALDLCDLRARVGFFFTDARSNLHLNRYLRRIH